MDIFVKRRKEEDFARHIDPTQKTALGVQY